MGSGSAQALSAGCASLRRRANPEAGINELFLHSDRRYYFLKCPVCGHEQKLVWPDNIDFKRAQVVCRKARCRKPLDLWAAGRWIAEAPGSDRIRGYHLNRLYSPLANLRQMIYESEATTPSEVQEFQNSVLGETFLPSGGGLTLDVLDRCRRDYDFASSSKERNHMGVDVGLKLHVVVRQVLGETKASSRALFIGELDSFGELAEVAQRYNVVAGVIDAQPEMRAAADFAKTHGGIYIRLANYGRSELGTDSHREGGVTLLGLNRNRGLGLNVRCLQDRRRGAAAGRAVVRGAGPGRRG